METANTTAPVRAANAIRKLIVDRALGPEETLPSHRDLSRQLGFSYMTICAANGLLANEGIVRCERGRGTFVVTPLRPEQLATSSRKQKLIGYVYVNQESDNYASQQFRIMERQFKAKGYPIVMGVLHGDDFGRILPSSFDSLKLDALIIDGFLSRAYLHQLVQLGKPLVVAGNHSAHDKVPCVKIDFDQMSYLLTNELFNQGMEAVSLICEPFYMDYTRELVAGYQRALLDKQRGPELITLFNGQQAACATNSLRQAFTRFGPKLGILAYAFNTSVIASLAAEQVDISQSIIVIDIKDSIFYPGVRQSVYTLPVERMATEAVESLCRILDGESVGDKALSPSLSSLNVDGRVNFDWQVCEEQIKSVSRESMDSKISSVEENKQTLA